MSKNIEYLRRIDGEIMSLKIHMPLSGRIKHLEEVIRPDVVSHMSQEELEAYSNRGLSAKEIAKKEAEDLARMSENKDSNSI